MILKTDRPRGGEAALHQFWQFWESPSVDDLARTRSVGSLERVEALRAPIWESDEELERFLVDVYAARRQSKTT